MACSQLTIYYQTQTVELMGTEMVEKIIQRVIPQRQMPLSWSVLEQDTKLQAVMTIADSVIVGVNG